MNEVGQNPWVTLLRQSFVDTRGAARVLNALRFDRGTLWGMLMLICVLRVLLFQAVMWLLPVTLPVEVASISLFSMTAILAAGLIATVFGLYFTGQSLGGSGRFPGTLLMIIWWQVLGMVLQIVQVLTALLLPFISVFVSFGSLIFMFYCLILFINELHGFQNIFKALTTIILASIAALVGLSVILSLIGITAQGGLV